MRTDGTSSSLTLHEHLKRKGADLADCDLSELTDTVDSNEFETQEEVGRTASNRPLYIFDSAASRYRDGRDQL